MPADFINPATGRSRLEDQAGYAMGSPISGNAETPNSRNLLLLETDEGIYSGSASQLGVLVVSNLVTMLMTIAGCLLLGLVF